MGSTRFLRAFALAFLAVVASCSSGSPGSNRDTAPTEQMSAACGQYSSLLRRCLAQDPPRLQRVLAQLAVPSPDPETAARRDESCALEATRLRRACQ
jgi:hypothetical protein